MNSLDFQLDFDSRYGDPTSPEGCTRDFNPRTTIAGIVIVASACSAGGGGEALQENPATIDGVTTPTTLATTETIAIKPIEREISNAVDKDGMPNKVIEYDASKHSLSDFVYIAAHNRAVAVNLRDASIAKGYIYYLTEGVLADSIEKYGSSESYYSETILDISEEKQEDGTTLFTASTIIQPITTNGDDPNMYFYEPTYNVLEITLLEDGGELPRIIEISTISTES